MNIYLTGIMGCGKTTLGCLTAQILGMPFLDLDEAIVDLAGKSIPDIFQEGGEALFRKQETEALRAVSKRHGQLVATGGGILLRRENIRIMEDSGIICWIQRELTDILGDLDASGRPMLGGDPARLAGVYQERLPLYQSTAQLVFLNHGEPEEAALHLSQLLLQFLEGEKGENES